MKKNVLVIAETNQFNELIELVHDEYFELADVKYTAEQNMVQIPYRRIFHEGPLRLIRNLFILKTYEVDVIRSVLTIRNVKKLDIQDTAQIGTYSFNTIFYKDNDLYFRCEPGLELKMMVSQIAIESRDVEIKGKSRVTHGLFWSSDTGRIYD